MNNGDLISRVIIRDEADEDHEAVHSVHAAAFGRDVVIDLVRALRIAAAPIPPRSFVASLDARVVGHVMLSAGRVDAPRRIVNVLMLSPLGVLPEHQSQGIGHRLVQHALHAADRLGVPLVFLEGSPEYYAKSGFVPAIPLGFRRPSLRMPEAGFQVATLSSYQPWMSGTFVYSETLWDLDLVGMRDPEGEGGET